MICKQLVRVDLISLVRGSFYLLCHPSMSRHKNIGISKNLVTRIYFRYLMKDGFEIFPAVFILLLLNVTGISLSFKCSILSVFHRDYTYTSGFFRANSPVIVPFVRRYESNMAVYS